MQLAVVFILARHDAGQLVGEQDGVQARQSCRAMLAASRGSNPGAPSNAPTAILAVFDAASNHAAQLASANSPVLRQNL